MDYKNFVDSNVDDFDQLAVIVENVVAQTEKVAISSYKSVRFADDCGKDLTTVRIISEPSDYPPTISASVCFLHLYTHCSIHPFKS